MDSPEIIGVGAVNLDYIIDSRRVADRVGADEPVSFDGFTYGGERSATGAEIEAALRRLEPLGPVPSPGGSALNTLATIAASGAPVSLGYVGVRGSEPIDGFSFPEWFASLGIDDRFVAPAEDVTGICVSYTDGGQRSMLTTDGANRRIMDHIADHADELAAYLGGAELVLVTSFANLTDIGPLVDLIRAVTTDSPAVQICVDPGALWSIGDVPAGIDDLLDLADVVLLNRQEHAVYNDRGPGQTVLVKAAEHVEMYGPASPSDSGAMRRYPNPQVLAADEVVDDTGAGDAFAGGFLPSLVLDDLSVADGVELGFALATEKLRWAGLAGIHRYEEIYRRLRG